MTLVPTEEQELLQQTARDFLREKSPVKAFRALRDRKEADGFEREPSREMCELGWAGVPFSEDVGGAGLGYAELGLMFEELGQTLAATPAEALGDPSGGAAVLERGAVALSAEMLGGGLYLKRARVAELTLGDGGYHRDRFARLQGY